MPAKTQYMSAEEIASFPLPTHGKSYTVIPHEEIIRQTVNELNDAAFIIKDIKYKGTHDGQVAQAIYHLNWNEDPEMGLMFAWTNSYNKQMRFKSAVGAYVFVCDNGVVSGDMGSYSRKHSGSALQDMTIHIRQQLQGAGAHFQKLVAVREELKQINLTTRVKGELLGRLMVEYDILTNTQAGIIRREMEKPSFDYKADPDSAWTMYNHVTLALKESHPAVYLKDHARVHEFFVDEFGVLQQTPLARLLDTIESPKQVNEAVAKPSTLDVNPLAQIVRNPYNLPEWHPHYGVTFL